MEVAEAPRQWCSWWRTSADTFLKGRRRNLLPGMMPTSGGAITFDRCGAPPRLPAARTPCRSRSFNMMRASSPPRQLRASPDLQTPISPKLSTLWPSNNTQTSFCTPVDDYNRTIESRTRSCHNFPNPALQI